jgi:hypothetical protein
MGGDHQPLGQLWVSTFVQRNPQVASVLVKKPRAVRADAASPQQVEAFLEVYEQVREEKGISIEAIRKSRIFRSWIGVEGLGTAPQSAM